MLNKVIARNSNIIFNKIKDCKSANLVMNFLDGIIDDDLHYEGNLITQMIITLNLDLDDINNTNRFSDSFLHPLMHSVLDHPCENGFYPCSKEMIAEMDIHTILGQSNYNKFFMNNADHAISLQPWDLAALRYSYGMPQQQNITYNLFSLEDLHEEFGYPIHNNSIFTLSNVGNSIINITAVDSYALNLNYDYKSNVCLSDTCFEAFLSYDTEISQVIINQSGSVVLNNKFKTDLILGNGCYEITVHGYFYSEETYINDIDCYSDSLEKIDIYNFNPSIHEIYFQD